MNTELLLDGDFIKKAIAIVKDAKRNIWICAYDWRWYADSPEEQIQTFNKYVLLASRRGVDVRVICDKRTGAQVLAAFGIPARYLPTTKTLHTKAIMVDDRCLILGSHNLTIRGSSDNLECSVAVSDLEPILLFNEYFDRMWLHLTMK